MILLFTSLSWAFRIRLEQWYIDFHRLQLTIWHFFPSDQLACNFLSLFYYEFSSPCLHNIYPRLQKRKTCVTCFVYRSGTLILRQRQKAILERTQIINNQQRSDSLSLLSNELSLSGTYVLMVLISLAINPSIPSIPLSFPLSILPIPLSRGG